MIDETVGRKDDDGKLRWDLIPFEQLEDVVSVLTFGAVKYSEQNWKEVKWGVSRYLAATFRHIVAYIKGEKLDPETGLPHLAHACCCLLFLMWLSDNK